MRLALSSSSGLIHILEPEDPRNDGRVYVRCYGYADISVFDLKEAPPDAVVTCMGCVVAKPLGPWWQADNGTLVRKILVQGVPAWLYDYETTGLKP